MKGSARATQRATPDYSSWFYSSSPAAKIPAIWHDRLGAVLPGDCARRIQRRRLARGGVRRAHSIRRIPALRGAGRGGDYQKQNEIGRASCRERVKVSAGDGGGQQR